MKRAPTPHRFAPAPRRGEGAPSSPAPPPPDGWVVARTQPTTAVVSFR